MGILFDVFRVLIVLGMAVVMIASWWIIFDKMGEKGWKSLIPFYGKYVLFERVWESKMYFISLIFNGFAFVFNGFTIFKAYQFLVENSLDVAAFVISGFSLIIFSVIFSFIAFAIQMILNWRMVKCFGKGVGFFLGLTFIPIIFMPILAFGNAYYDYY